MKKAIEHAWDMAGQRHMLAGSAVTCYSDDAWSSDAGTDHTKSSEESAGEATLCKDEKKARNKGQGKVGKVKH